MGLLVVQRCKQEWSIQISKFKTTWRGSFAVFTLLFVRSLNVTLHISHRHNFQIFSANQLDFKIDIRLNNLTKTET